MTAHDPHMSSPAPSDTPQASGVGEGYTRPSALIPLSEPLKRKVRVALNTFREARADWERSMSLREWLDHISEGAITTGSVHWAWSYGRVDSLAELLGFSCDLTALAEAVGWDADNAEEWGQR